MKSGNFFLSMLLLLFIFNFSVTAHGLNMNLGGINEGMNFGSPSGPTLLYPVTDNIVLTGKDFLEFRWERTDLVNTDHYEFRLFKGYKTLEATLILKQDSPAGTFPIKIAASLFEEGQVYTWSLRRVYFGGNKSDFSYSPFKIVKK